MVRKILKSLPFQPSYPSGRQTGGDQTEPMWEAVMAFECSEVENRRRLPTSTTFRA